LLGTEEESQDAVAQIIKPGPTWEIEANTDQVHREIEEDNEKFGVIKGVVRGLNHRKDAEEPKGEFLIEFKNSVRLWSSAGFAYMDAPNLVTKYVAENKLRYPVFESITMKRLREAEDKKNLKEKEKKNLKEKRNKVKKT
jgi:hypothetical protein